MCVCVCVCVCLGWGLHTHVAFNWPAGTFVFGFLFLCSSSVLPGGGGRGDWLESRSNRSQSIPTRWRMKGGIGFVCYIHELNLRERKWGRGGIQWTSYENDKREKKKEIQWVSWNVNGTGIRGRLSIISRHKLSAGTSLIVCLFHLCLPSSIHFIHIYKRKRLEDNHRFICKRQCGHVAPTWPIRKPQWNAAIKCSYQLLLRRNAFVSLWFLGIERKWRRCSEMWYMNFVEHVSAHISPRFVSLVVGAHRARIALTRVQI